MERAKEIEAAIRLIASLQVPDDLGLDLPVRQRWLAYEVMVESARQVIDAYERGSKYPLQMQSNREEKLKWKS